jgi:hypothetical protein
LDCSGAEKYKRYALCRPGVNLNYFPDIGEPDLAPRLHILRFSTSSRHFLALLKYISTCFKIIKNKGKFVFNVTMPQGVKLRVIFKLSREHFYNNNYYENYQSGFGNAFI